MERGRTVISPTSSIFEEKSTLSGPIHLYQPTQNNKVMARSFSVESLHLSRSESSDIIHSICDSGTTRPPRGTTSRRGGKGGPLMAVSSYHRNEKPMNTFQSPPERAYHRFRNISNVNTPSNAAAAAAATAKRLCEDNSNMSWLNDVETVGCLPYENNDTGRSYSPPSHEGLVQIRQHPLPSMNHRHIKRKHDDGTFSKSRENNLQLPISHFHSRGLESPRSHEAMGIPNAFNDSRVHIRRKYDGVKDSFLEPATPQHRMVSSIPVSATRAGPRGDPHSVRPRMSNDPSSVFRKSPNHFMTPIRSSPDNAAQTLLSLRTPTKSFGDDDDSGVELKLDSSQVPLDDQPLRETSEPFPLSPQAPPQIQNSHHQRENAITFLFDQQRTPATPLNFIKSSMLSSTPLIATPTFNLFGASFDSLTDNVEFPHSNPSPVTALGADTLQCHSFASDYSDEFNRQGQYSTRNKHSSSFCKDRFEYSNQPRPTGESIPLPSNVTSKEPSLLSKALSRTAIAASPVSNLNHQRKVHTPNLPFKSNKPSLQLIPPQPYINQEAILSPPGRDRERWKGIKSSQIFISEPTSLPNSYNGSELFYSRLVSHQKAFADCNFLLPGLKDTMFERSEFHPSKSSPTRIKMVSDVAGGINRLSNTSNLDIARRRIKSAVCAFGGNYSRETNQEAKREDEQSLIFRGIKIEMSDRDETSVKNTTTNYFESNGRISWDVEESPVQKKPHTRVLSDDSYSSNEKKDVQGSLDNFLNVLSENSNEDKDNNIEDTSCVTSEQQKLRYRCKLCGKPKQNHICPMQQSIQRSIGAMIYPALNAYNAHEPGVIAPALSEMNNFIQGQDEVFSPENSPSPRPTPDRLMIKGMIGHDVTNYAVPPTKLTPDFSRSNLSTCHRTSPNFVGSPSVGRSFPHSTNTIAGTHKRDMEQTMESRPSIDSLFVQSTPLRPEQYRKVSSKIDEYDDAFRYPMIPLPYNQRKSLSDNLFAMSKEIDKLTDDCAEVLRDARTKDAWDNAVAELLTQVLVAAHCPVYDSRLDGLSNYLMSMGFAC